jgi:hypothetical protein
MLKIYTTVDQTQTPQDLQRTVPVPPQVPQPYVEIPGVLNQARNLYRPYTGRDAKDTK